MSTAWFVIKILIAFKKHLVSMQLHSFFKQIYGACWYVQEIIIFSILYVTKYLFCY